MSTGLRRIPVLFAALGLASLAGAAPFETTVRFVQPGGAAVDLWGKGDEFYAVFETLDGYTVLFDHARRAYVYASLSPDGVELVSSGLAVGQGDPAALGLEKHLRMSQERIQQEAKARFAQWDAETQTSERWLQKKTAMRAFEDALAAGKPLMAPPSFTTTGTKAGLCLLIDFYDDTNTVPQAEIISFCNGDAYSGYGNNGSVKRYFQDNSNSLLTYTNIVTAYIRMAQPKSFFNDTAKSCGTQGRLLITNAVGVMKALPNYATEIAPAFSNLTLDASGRAVACNVFYAGGNGGVWSYGLWPHSSSLGTPVQLVAGVSISKYQLTNIGTALELGTFCHENGHMLCGFPDIYDYEYDSSGGAGAFCLMNSGGHGTNPNQICAYLKRASGWATVIDLTSASSLAASVFSSGEGFNRFYRYAKPGVPKEYYLIENRQKKGRDAKLPAAGIAIWHIDESGNKDNQSLAYNTGHQNYEVTLMQADNKWHFQKNSGSGDTNDLFYSGNAVSGYLNRFNDTDEPRARWWDGTVSGINFSAFSASGTNMTFQVVPAGVVLVTTSTLTNGFAGVPYSRTLLATNGTPPYAWSLVSNTLPQGLSLSAGGVISGTPGAATSLLFRIRAADSLGLCATGLFSLAVHAPKAVPCWEPFESGGTLPASWSQEYLTGTTDWRFLNGGYSSNPSSARGGAFDACFYTSTYNAMNRKTKLISPMLDFGPAPAGARVTFWHGMKYRSSSYTDALRLYYRTSPSGAWSLLATYTNEAPSWTQRTVALPNASRTYFIAFEGAANYGYGACVDDVFVTAASSPPIMTLSSNLVSQYAGLPYNQTLGALGGTAPYAWSVTSNALPQGLSLSADGVISGSATAPTNLLLRLRVADSAGLATTNLFSLSIFRHERVPFAEPFESGRGLPADWTQSFVSGTTAWLFRKGGNGGANPAAAHGGSTNACFYSSTKGRATKLVSPMLDFGLSPLSGQLTFWHCMVNSGTNQDQLRIYYKTAVSNSWVLLASYSNAVPSWTQRTLPLPSPSRTYFVAFEGTANAGYGVCLDDVSVSGTSPYTVWRTNRFSQAEIAAGGVAGDEDDPDSDRVANLLEYALGLNPRSADAAGLPVGGVWDPYLWLSYRQSKQATDLLYEVEACTSLVENAWSTNGVAEIARADSNQWWQVTTRHDTPVTGAPRRFMRLRVTLP